MQIEWFEQLDSTQKELERRINALNPNEKAKDICIVAQYQTEGIGSRGNTWENETESLMFSFIYSHIPLDIPKQSLALFFGFVCKESLRSLGSNVWLKYPNDIYIQDKKLGGVIVKIHKQAIICGIGLNLKSKKFGALDIHIDKKAFLEIFFKDLQNTQSWKQIFRKYKLEFYKNFSFSFHIGDKLVSFKDAKLLEDGSIQMGERKIYNLRDYGADNV